VYRVLTHISKMEWASSASATTGNDVIVSATVQYRDVLTHEQLAGQTVTAWLGGAGSRESASAHAQR